MLSEAGAFDNTAVHGAQELVVHGALPRSGSIELSARVGDVFDKGSAAIFEVIVDCEQFTATWTLFAPGVGGFGGDRGPSRAAPIERGDASILSLETAPTQAALYRLTGDRHHIHIDPAASARIGQPVPILQGLCTIAAATLPLADSLGAHPADLTRLSGRFSGPVIPGDRLSVHAWADGAFDIRRGDDVVVSDGLAEFA